MPRKVAGKAVLILLIIAGLLGGAAPNAFAYQQYSDPDETTGRGGTPDEGDVKTLFWWDDADGIILGFQSHDGTITPADVTAQFTFDLYGTTGTPPIGAPGSTPDGVPGELCVLVQQGASFQATLYAGCGGEGGNGYAVTQPSPDKIQFEIPKSELVTAGLAASATSYKFRMSNQNARGEVDQVPDTSTTVLTHTYGESPPPPPPPVGAQQDTDEQGVNAGNPGGGILDINAVQDNVALGSASPGSTKVAPVGDIDYTNTLASGLSWTVTVEATSLKAGAANIHFSNLKFTGGSSISQLPAGAGDNPTPNTTLQPFGVATDADPTPGQSYSVPVTIANAGPTIQGAFRQSGSALTLVVPASQAPGTYAGKLRYTITG